MRDHDTEPPPAPVPAEVPATPCAEPARSGNGAGDPAAAVEQLAGEAAEKLQAAAVAAAAQGSRSVLALLRDADPDRVHRAVRGVLPPGWRATVPDLAAISPAHWRLILSWLALEWQLGFQACASEMLPLVAAAERSQPPAPAR